MCFYHGLRQITEKTFEGSDEKKGIYSQRQDGIEQEQASLEDGLAQLKAMQTSD